MPPIVTCAKTALDTRVMIDDPMLRTRLVVVLALVTTYAFFLEYLPPFKRVHLYSDIEDFHYPLHAFAFQALRQGRIPQWDPSMYCGISFTGNLHIRLIIGEPPQCCWNCNCNGHR